VAFELESLGAMSSHGAGLDAAQSSLRCAAPDFPAALDVLVDCIRRPAFDPAELEIERDAVLAHLMRAEDEKFEFTYRQYLKRIFEGHGYGHSPEGEPDDVRAITPEACRAWHLRAYRPENLMFVAAGEFEPDALVDQVIRVTEGWSAATPTHARYELAGPPGAPPPRLELRKPLEQGFHIVGFRTPAMTHEDFPALRLACAALGEGFSGRLFTHLRDERSLAYAVGSSLNAYRLCGHMMLYIGTQPERMDEALEGLLSEAGAAGSRAARRTRPGARPQLRCGQVPDEPPVAGRARGFPGPVGRCRRRRGAGRTLRRTAVEGDAPGNSGRHRTMVDRSGHRFAPP
jgi:zinc protease